MLFAFCSVNPLGKQGAVAMEFAWLMKALWGGQYKSVSPRDFKVCDQLRVTFKLHT